MEKKKSIGFKKIIVSILSILFVVCAYVPCIPKVNALSNVTTSNSYGGYTWQIHDMSIDMSGNATLQSGNISMNLNGHYNGSFTINISLSTIINTNGVGYTNSINKYGFIAYGCVINGYDASHLYVSIYNSNYWEIEIIPMVNATLTNPMPILNAFDILSITGWSMTKLDEVSATQITTIANTLTSINSNISTTNSRLTTTNTELHNIYNSLGNSAQYGTVQTQLHGLAVNTTSMINELQDIDNHLQSYLTGTIDNQTVNIWDLQNDANYSLNNIESTLNTINNNINDYTSQLNTIQNTLSSIDTNLANIDNTIDTITWRPISYTFVGGSSTYSTEDNVYSLSNVVGANAYFKYYINNTNYNQSSLFHISIPYAYYRLNRNTDILVANSSSINVATIKYYVLGRQNIDLYIDITGFSAQYLIIQIKSLADTTLYYNRGKDKVENIKQDDIEYWSLMSYFEQYNSNLRILDAINSISVNITQNDITEMNNNITEYNTTMTDINQIENNYINNFNTLDNSIDLSNNSTPSVNLVNTRTQFNSVFNDLTGDLRIRGILILVLVCGLILILLGA